MKNLMGKILMVLNNKMITASTASTYTVGIEDMPESMKKMR